MVRETHLHEVCCELMAEVVRDVGSANVRVTGFSMLPSIHPGDVLTVRRHAIDELTPGQVVLFSRNGKLIAHRIIQISGEHLITRGDSVPSCDPPVRIGDVVGRVEAISRNGRQIDSRNSFRRRIAATAMRRSEWCTRLFLRATAVTRRFAVSPSTATN